MGHINFCKNIYFWFVCLFVIQSCFARLHQLTLIFLVLLLVRYQCSASLRIALDTSVSHQISYLLSCQSSMLRFAPHRARHKCLVLAFWVDDVFSFIYNPLCIRFDIKTVSRGSCGYKVYIFLVKFRILSQKRCFMSS